MLLFWYCVNFKDKQNFSHTVISKTKIGIAQLNAPSEFQGR